MIDLQYLRMLRAALRQALHDRAKFLNEKEIDAILDQISELTKVIEKLEGKI